MGPLSIIFNSRVGRKGKSGNKIDEMGTFVHKTQAIIARLKNCAKGGPQRVHL